VRWSGRDWTVTVTDTELTADHPSGTVAVASVDASTLAVRRSWFHRFLHHRGKPVLRLRGISRGGAKDLKRAIRHLALMPAVEDALA
jgi:hypothetical protein